MATGALMGSGFSRPQAWLTPLGVGRWAGGLLAAVFILAAATVVPAQADDGRQLVDSLGERVIAVLKKDAGQAERRADLESVLRDYFDLPEIARLVLGRHWRKADDGQQKRYLELFADYVVAVYSGQFGNYGGQTFAVIQSRPVDRSETMVTAQIQGNEGPPVVLNFRIHPTSQGPRIVDVAVEGVSMLITMRDEFSSVVNREGIDGLLRRLEEKVNSA